MIKLVDNSLVTHAETIRLKSLLAPVIDEKLVNVAVSVREYVPIDVYLLIPEATTPMKEVLIN